MDRKEAVKYLLILKESVGDICAAATGPENRAYRRQLNKMTAALTEAIKMLEE